MLPPGVATAKERRGLEPREVGCIVQEEKVRQPVRSVQEWRPDPLLCKRFNVPDPFKGKPALQVDQTSRFKSEQPLLLDTGSAPAPLQPRLDAPPHQVHTAEAPSLLQLASNIYTGILGKQPAHSCRFWHVS